MPSLIGNKPNQVPSNGDLGTLAFQDANAVNITGGVVDVSAGTAALPTLGTTGDENTGVFFPAADTVAVSTNGVERVRVSDTGNVGINAASPTFRLQVEADANGTAGAFIRNSNTGSTASGNLTVASGVGGLNLRAHSAAHSVWANSTQILTDSAFTGGLNILTVGASPISLWTNSTERMRIDAAGNVIIGTTSVVAVGAQFASYKTTGNGTYLGYANGGTLPKVSAIGLGSDAVTFTYTSGGSTFALVGSAQIAALQSASSGAPTDLAFYTTSGGVVAERMRITSTGNVGIGTSSPDALLSVNGIASFGDGAAATPSIANFGDLNTGFWFPAADTIAASTAGSERMRIDSSGNVFIGTTTAGGKFNVLGITNTTAASGTYCNNNEGVKVLSSVVSGTLTTVATLTKPGTNSVVRRVVFSVTATNDGVDAGYAAACSVREVLMSNYGGSTHILKSTELSNNIGSINAGVISVALTTAAALSGTSVLLQATATITGSASSGLTAVFATKVEIISATNYQDITFA